MVAFLVSFLFVLMMGVENLYNMIRRWWSQKKGKVQEEKNPAELVGTFKRYK